MGVDFASLLYFSRESLVGGKLELDLGNGSGGVETLGAGARA